MIEFSGPAFAHVDNRLMSLKLVQHGPDQRGHVHAPTGEVLQPSDVLYKKCHPRRARQLPAGDQRHVDMLRCAQAQFVQEPTCGARTIVGSWR